jgi:hypothetical protein
MGLFGKKSTPPSSSESHDERVQRELESATRFNHLSAKAARDRGEHKLAEAYEQQAKDCAAAAIDVRVEQMRRRLFP